MRTNIEKVLERDQKLSELDDRAGEGNDFIFCLAYLHRYLLLSRVQHNLSLLNWKKSLVRCFVHSLVWKYISYRGRLIFVPEFASL